MRSYHYLIVGNGAAGLSAAEIIRKRDPRGRVTIVTKEPYLFYSRPGIAYYILNQLSERQLIARSESFYRQHNFHLRFGTITHLDLEGQLVFMDSGEPLAYDCLLLATGASAVPPPFPGGDLNGVQTFDSLDDAKQVLKRSRKAKNAVVVGGGITAMELAEGFQHNGAKTHLIQRRDRIWPRLFDGSESALVEKQIKKDGIVIHYNDEITEIIGKKGRVAGVRLKSGRTIRCQIVGVAIGVRPNIQLTDGQSIEVDRGILVNKTMQSNRPTLFAAGDVAQVFDRWTGQHNLDVLWPSAIQEGRAAGYNMVDVAHGRQPRYHYKKSSPFNCALLFGLHLTVIGRVGSSSNNGQKELAYLSRGSSHVWTSPLSSSHRSAWDRGGPSSIRIVMDDDIVVGAVLIGNQELADPLRRLIEGEADISRYKPELLRGGEDLREVILRAWRNWHQQW
jgi:NAD(P)H-nitrite reductase large subunit